MKRYFTFLIILASLFITSTSYAQLSGTYTIDKTKSGATNFRSFAAAITSLNASGISGAVVFKVANSSYNEQITLNFVSGSSATKTITFEGADSSKVNLNYNCSQYEAVVKVNAAANFIFKGMTIESTNNTYGYGLHITAGARNISVQNCRIKVASRTGIGADCIPINIAGTTYNTTGDNGEDISVKNSVIEGGYFGVNIQGTNNSLLAKNFTLSHNQFTGQYVYCIYAVYAQDLDINYCTIDNTILYYAYGIYTNQCAGGNISNNKIYVGRFGMYLYLHNYYNRSDSLTIINNEISDFDDASYQAGIYSSYNYNLRIYHNTISTNGTVSDFTYSCLFLAGPFNHIVVNNNLKASGNNSVFSLGAGTLGSTLIDNNNYHAGTNGGLISWQGTTYNDLSALKSAVSGQNQNSTNEDPLFSGKRNLIPKAPGINNRGRKGYASVDLLGKPRPKAPDNIPDFGAYEYYISPVDLDLIDLPNPVIAQIGKNTIGLTIKNNGSQNYRDSVFVQYNIDNGTWIKDTAIFTNLKIGETSTFQFTKPWNLTSSGTYQVCATISPMLKGDPDSLVGDTFCTYKCVGRTGTYVIDSKGGGDYKTFADAVSSLGCGIAGPVKFVVKAGVYKERVVLEEVLGASATNTITFEGEDKSTAILEYDGTSSQPASILVNDADYFIFKNLTVKNQGNQVANGFWLREDAHDITIDNCIIQLDSVSANYATTGILVANSVSSSAATIPGNTSHDLYFTRNTIVGGSHGIRVNGSGSTLTSANINITQNEIRKFYYEGINAAYVRESKISKNIIKAPRVYIAFGLSMYFSNKDSIDGNYIEGGRYGLYLYYENTYDMNTFSTISNNMITNMIDPNYQIGLYAAVGYNLSIYNNSVWTTGSFSNAFYTSLNLYYCTNSYAKNNSLKATNGGMCFSQYYGTISIGSVDYNNYYCDAAAKYYHDGLTFSDLKTWKAVKTQFNQNSKEGEPNYNSLSDLHATGSQLNNSAQKGLGVNRDFDGQKRPFSPDKKVDIGADEYYVSPYDIDLIALDSPIVPIIGSNEIKVILRNTGIKALDNDTIVLSYLVDGTLQVRDTVIINSLNPNANYLYTFSKNWDITTGKTYQLCAQLDTFFKPDPDSLTKQKKCATMCPGARGTYTIDKKGTGDFKTFRGAIRSLGCGINGPVKFVVKNGTYNERIYLKEIIGASKTNTISFVGESATDVRVHYTGRLDSMEVVRLEGTDFFTFENINFKNFSTVYSRGVWMSHIADYNTFKNCRFDIPITAANGYCMPVYISDDGLSTVGNAGNYNVFENCTLRGGYYGARLDGIGATSLNYGNTFKSCNFSRNRVFGVYALYQGELNIQNCVLDSLRESYYQLYIYMCSKTNIESNIIRTGRWGLYLIYENYYFQEETSNVVNNLISGQSYTVDNYAMDIYICYNTKIFHNSVNMSQGTSGAVVQFRYGSGLDFRNNAISKSTNAELFINTSASFTGVDFNNYYKGSSNNFVSYNGTSYDDLAKWKAAVNGFNRNSKEGNPGFRSATDLTIDPISKQLANWGSITTGITTDYEGDIRNPQAPDVGADEYSDLYDLGISAILSPNTNCELKNNEVIRIEVKNFGGKTVPSGELIPVSYSLNGGAVNKDTFILASNLANGKTVNFNFAKTGNFSSFKAYSIKAWTDLSNDSTRNNDTLTKNINSFEYPSADFSYSNICSNEDVVFTDNTAINTSSIAAYKWTFGNGKTANIKNPKTQYNSAGTYNVKLVVTTANGCKDSLTKSLEIKTKPQASYTSASLCFGDSAKFTNTSNIVSAIGASFKWNFDDGNNSTKTSPKNKFASTGDYDVQLIATSSDGCIDTAISTVSISPNPIASFTSANSCKGDSSEFTNTSNVPVGFTPSYTWSFGDGNSSTKENPTYLYGAIGSYNVSLKASLTNGCSSTAVKTINIFSKPQPIFSVTDACNGDSAAFNNASVIQLDTIKTNFWQFGDGKTSTDISPKHLYKANASYNVKLILTSVNGCQDSLSKTINVFEKPVASFTQTDVCETDTSYFNSTSTITSGSLSNYNWSFGDGFSSSQKVGKHVYAKYGTYNVQLVVTSDKGCADTANVSTTVNAKPIADFDASNVCFGSNLFPTNKSSIASGSIASYFWDFDDGSTSTNANPVYKYPAKGSYDLKLVVTSNKGCKDSTLKTIIVDSKVVPGFNTSEVCLGDSSAFTNTSSISCGAVNSYLWKFGDGTKSTLFQPKHLFKTAGTYSVKLILFLQGGLKDSITKNVVVNANPSTAFSVNNSCANQSVSFTNSSTIATGSIANYSWNFGDGNKSNVASPTHTYTTKGSYSIKLTTVSNKGCKDSITKTIDVYELPSTQFSVSNACLGSAVNFSNSSSITTGTLSYSWKFGDGFSSTQTNPQYTYASNGTYTVELTATSNNNCSAKASKQVTIHPKPKANFSATSQCANTAITFSNSSTISSGTVSYNWKFGDKTTSTAVNPSHLYASPGTYFVTLIVTSNNGCIDSVTKSVSSLPTPIANFTVPSPCSGTKLTFSNASSVSTGTMSYAWSFGDGNTSTATNPLHTYTSTGTYTVKLVTTAASGCKDSVSKVANVFDLPTASFSVTGKCLADDIEFANTTTIASGTVTYKWNLGDGTTSTAKDINHKYAAAGTYQVKLVATSNGGCTDSSTQTINVYPSPEAVFTANDVCLGADVSFNNSSTIKSGTISYFWDFDNGNASTLKSPIVEYKTAKAYNVELFATSNNGCVDSVSQVVNVFVNPSASFAYAKTCLDDTTTFTNSSSISTGSFTSFWNFDDGNTSALNNPSNRFTKTGSYLVELITTSTNGCSDTAKQTLVVNPKALAKFATNNICFGSEASFKNNSSLSKGSFASSWKFGDGKTSLTNSPKHTYTSSGTYLVELKLTTDSGCVTSKSEVLVVNNKPNADFSASNVCQNETATFTNNSSIASGKIDANSWTFGDGFIASTDNATHNYSGFGTYNVRLISTSDSACSDTFSTALQIYAVPKTAFLASNVCFGDTLYPTNNSTIATGSISTNNWKFGDGGTSKLKSPLHYYNAKGTYTIQLNTVSNNGCKDSVTKQVTVDNVVVPGFNFTNVCLGQQVDFVNTTNVSCGSISSYQWQFGNGKISSQANPSHTYTSAGTYNVQLIVTEKSGRKDTISQQVTIYPKPVVSFTVSDVCAGTPASFSNNTSIASGSISKYTWDFGNGTKSTATAPVYAYTTHGSYAIKLLAESNNGCKDSAIYSSLSVFEVPQTAFIASTSCVYDNAVFTNKSSISAGTLSYEWSFGDANTSTTTSPTHKYAAAGNYSVVLKSTSTKGCSSTSTKAITINYKPLAAILVDTVCLGNANSFSNISSITKGNISTSLWSFGDGFSSSNLNTNHTYSNSGFYNVRLISVSDSGCSDTSFARAGVNALPKVDFTANNVCLGDALSPSNNSTISTGSISSWKWSFGDGKVSTVKSPSNTYASKGTYTVKLVATSDNGCKDSLSKQVVVDNVIKAGFTTANICLGDTAFFTNTSSTSCGTVTGYQWAFGDGGAATSQNAFRIYKTAGTFSVRLIVLQAGGNRDTFTTDITVHDKPKVAFAAANDCVGEQVQFQNNSTIATGNIASYTWNFADGTKDIAKNPKHTYTNSGSYLVSLSATSDNGCTDSIKKTIIAYPTPTASFSASDVCNGQTVAFSNTSSISSGTINYAWSFGDGFSSSQKDPNYKYAAAGTYTVELKVTSTNGCQDIITKNVKVFEMPVVGFTYKDTCQNDAAIFTNTSKISSGTLGYQWSFGDGKSSSQQSPIYYYSKPGTYNIKLRATSTTGCADSLTKQINIFEKAVASFSYSATCPDKPVSFSSTSTSKRPIAGLVWEFNGKDISLNASPSYQFTGTGPHQVILAVITADNCVDTAKQVILFESVPVVDFAFGSGCERDSIAFTNNTVLTKGTASYAWSFGDGKTSKKANPKHSFDNNQYYDVTLTATSDKGCTDNLTQSILPLEKPDVTFKTTGACLGDSTAFNNLTSAKAENNYVWSFDDNNATSTNYNAKYLYAKAGTYNVELKVTNTNCTDSLVLPVVISIGPKNLDFEFDNACANEKVTINNLTTNPNLTFRWVFFDGSFSTQKSPSKFYPKAGKFPIGFEAREGNCADSTYKVITIYGYADSSFTFKPLGNREVSFAPVDTNNNTYKWNFGDGNLSTLQEPSHTYATDGTYKVVLEVITENGCSNFSERVIVIKGNSISWLSPESMDFTVYPNPFSQFVNASFELTQNDMVQIEIYNEIGQLVLIPFSGELGLGKHNLVLIDNTNELRSGLYFVKLQVGESMSMKKILLAK